MPYVYKTTDEFHAAAAMFARLEAAPRACQESGVAKDNCIELQVAEGHDPGSMDPERMCLDCRAVLRAHQLNIAIADIVEAAPENGPSQNCAKCGSQLPEEHVTDEGEDGGVWRYCSERCKEKH